MRPLIALTPTFDLDAGKNLSNFTYQRRITEAGGLPMVVASTATQYTDELVQRADGLLLSGGCDIDPLLYGEAPVRGLGFVCPPRDELELTLCRAFVAAGKPVLGICRGIQALNVALGGSIWQDLASQKPDSWNHYQSASMSYPSHKTDVVPGSLLAQITGKTVLMTNSHHHESVKEPGKGLRIAATAGDGVIESVCGTGDSWILGVQWHPEQLDCDDTRAIFGAFIAACAGGAK